MAARKGKPENLKPFKAGESGNPGGRPKGVERRVRELCGDDGDALLSMFYAIAMSADEKTSDRMEAGKVLLERGWGRPAQLFAIDQEQGPFEFVWRFDPRPQE